LVDDHPRPRRTCYINAMLNIASTEFSIRDDTLLTVLVAPLLFANSPKVM
jgi:hypothetical protein